MSTKSLIATLVIDSNKGRDVATENVIRVYLNTDMDYFVAIKIEDTMIYFMAKADASKYSKHVHAYNKKRNCV